MCQRSNQIQKIFRLWANLTSRWSNTISAETQRNWGVTWSARNHNRTRARTFQFGVKLSLICHKWRVLFSDIGPEENKRFFFSPHSTALSSRRTDRPENIENNIRALVAELSREIRGILRRRVEHGGRSDLRGTRSSQKGTADWFSRLRRGKRGPYSTVPRVGGWRDEPRVQWKSTELRSGAPPKVLQRYCYPRNDTVPPSDWRSPFCSAARPDRQTRRNPRTHERQWDDFRNPRRNAVPIPKHSAWRSAKAKQFLRPEEEGILLRSKSVCLRRDTLLLPIKRKITQARRDRHENVCKWAGIFRNGR